MKTVKAWHFTNGKLRDGSPLPKKGVWLRREVMGSSCEEVEVLREIRDALEGLLIERVLNADVLIKRNDSQASFDRTLEKKAVHWLQCFVRDRT